MKPGERIRVWLGATAATAAFYLGAALAAPSLARALKDALADPHPAWGLGGLLLAVLLLEPFGLRWKLQFLRRRNRDEGFEPQGSMLGVFSAAGIGHVIVTMVLGLTWLDCWGQEASERALGIGLTTLILKEFAELFAAAGRSMSRAAPGGGRERLADLFLLAYGFVAYVVWWEALLDLGEVATEGWAMKLVLLPSVGGLFLFLYLPMRLPFLLDEYHLRTAPGRRRRFWTELAIGAALGLYPAFA